MDYEDAFAPSSDAAASQFGFGHEEAAGGFSFAASGDSGFAGMPATHSYEEDMAAVAALEVAETSDAFAHLSTDGNNKLAEFNAKWHQEHYERDEEERQAKAQRRAAGQEALGQLLDAKRASVLKRKESNRAAEAACERDMEAALSGESWTRVATMVDLTTADSAAHDVGRMKDVLIQLKAHGLPQAA